MTRFQFNSGDRPLDGYTIEYALGRGGFGEVYYAVSDAGRQVALKAVQNYEEIELRGIGPGPYCGMMLADMGAEVIRIDRAANVRQGAGGRGDLLARGRRSIAVDLKNPKGVETVLQLIDKTDVVIEGFRPGVMEKLGPAL